MKQLFVAVAMALLVGCLKSGGASSDEPGIPLTLKVVGVDGKVIPSAVIRHPEEQERHRVNSYDGTWTASWLIMPDGRELVFERDLLLEFEISAPGYLNKPVVYVMKRRKNSVEIALEKMDFSFEEDELDEPEISFGVDKPLQPGG
jgi:hypothetical protein